MNASFSRAAPRAAGALLVAAAALSPVAPQAEENPPSRIQARAEAGAFRLDLPDYSPFIETDSAERLTAFLDHYDASRQGGVRVGLAVGGATGPEPSDPFLEARGFAALHRSTQTMEFRRTSALWDALEAQQLGVTPERLRALADNERKEMRDAVFADEARRNALIDAVRDNTGLRFAGWIGAIDGQALRFTPNFLWGDAVRAHSRRKARYYGVDLVAGAPFAAGDRHLSLFAGPSVRVLSQRSELRAHEVTHRAPDDNFMTLHDRLQGVYWGAVAGGRLELPLGEDWSASVGGDIGVYRLNADYSASQRTHLGADPPLDAATTLDLGDSRTAAAFRLRASLGVALTDELTVGLEAGGEALSHAPQVRYAGAGDVFANETRHAGARLGYGAATGLYAAAALRAAF